MLPLLLWCSVLSFSLSHLKQALFTVKCYFVELRTQKKKQNLREKKLWKKFSNRNAQWENLRCGLREERERDTHTLRIQEHFNLFLHCITRNCRFRVWFFVITIKHYRLLFHFVCAPRTFFRLFFAFILFI